MNTRTKVELDTKLVAKTKKADAETTLQAYAAKPDYSGLLALEGSGVIADDYDPDEACARRAVRAELTGSVA